MNNGVMFDTISGIGGGQGKQVPKKVSLPFKLPAAASDPKKLSAALAMINADRKKQGKAPVVPKSKLSLTDLLNAAAGVATRGLEIIQGAQNTLNPIPVAPLPVDPPPPPQSGASMFSNPLVLGGAALALFLIMKKRW